MNSLSEIEKLIKIISKLPGLGPKSAKRIILKLINNRSEIMDPLSKSLLDVYDNVLRCKSCGMLKSNQAKCKNCEILNTNNEKICVVENIADQWAISTSEIYKGYFHVLGGTISNFNNENKENFLIDSLILTVKKFKIDEVILATSSTIEGQTTAFYINDSLKKLGVKITKLAQGIPIGGEIESLDDGTLISAFKNRKKIENI
ncbi:recombination mediator RecR [Candidatus Pelagibacter sp.]|nr:recombination mediator RecR [Candidatus Pelagibacter sp.]